MTNHDIAINLTSGQRGGFMKHLGHAYCMADSLNRQRLDWSFPHVFTEITEYPQLFMITTGNPVDGFEFIGPFITRDEAVSYGENLGHGDWWISELNRPIPD